MQDLELILFQLITNAGDARAFLFKALKASREEKFDDAENYVKDAETSLLKAHEFHSSLIHQEASGELVNISLLLIHAEDQLMATETLKEITKEMILTHKKYSK
ncbi:PTS lactose/cellobiose transporter subunit IIA [Tissierella sp. MSJ-40]|uniref:PTS lactose/cellobiose transporter subunit IIA n=1 Tax=Tissierella simiarum TaxID=2841534 RepID=A0ABS6E9V7_9FIRM|nr:PTS lactose/cellobiose transporter subunit IIA [Tissierella simiarum]MBU5439631.1 PTS lactose/cellobiose transporter subunit IIA [Tissierella simiarum]